MHAQPYRPPHRSPNLPPRAATVSPWATGLRPASSALCVALALAGCASTASPESQSPASATPAARAQGPIQRTGAPLAPQVLGANAAQTTAQPPSTPAPQSPAHVGTPGSDTEGERLAFAAWRTQFAPLARAAGLRPATIDQVLGNAQWLPRVVELDRAQPEFTRTPWAYLDTAVSAQRVQQGRAKRQEHAAALNAAAARYGVPTEIITAIWGMESNYGSHFGNFRTVDALATLAADGRRRAWAQSELIAALRTIEQGDISAERMVGSWAGAMGHTQFLPSVFLRYAVDADGDGHRDIWGSIPDVTASTAAFLAGEGWRSGEPWGTEVVLPKGFDYARTELSVRQSAGQWASEGVRATGGGTLPALDGASILTPAGAQGPAFLVGHNFRVLLRYNNAVTYALGVSFLAQRIAGQPGIEAPWPRTLPAMSRAQVLALQVALNAQGFSTGTPDGVLGPATRAGVRQFQQREGLVADGYASVDVLERVRASAAPR